MTDATPKTVTDEFVWMQRCLPTLQGLGDSDLPRVFRIEGWSLSRLSGGGGHLCHFAESRLSSMNNEGKIRFRNGRSKGPMVLGTSQIPDQIPEGVRIPVNQLMDIYLTWGWRETPLSERTASRAGAHSTNGGVSQVPPPTVRYWNAPQSFWWTWRPGRLIWPLPFTENEAQDRLDSEGQNSSKWFSKWMSLFKHTRVAHAKSMNKMNKILWKHRRLYLCTHGTIEYCL